MTYLSYPKPVISAGVCEVYDELEGFVVVWFQGKQHVVDEEVAVDFPNSGTGKCEN